MEDFMAPFLLLMGGRKGARLLNNIMKEMGRDQDSESGESLDEGEMQAFETFIGEHYHQQESQWLCDLCQAAKKTPKAMHSHFESEHFDDFLSSQ
jgi:hypothetical protein